MNFCLGFLFFCCLSGTFIFIILGIFTYSDNSFLIMQNMKKEGDNYVLFDEDSKKKAYLQYFIAALFDSIFALLIYSLNIYFENKKANQKPFTEIPTIKNEIAVINSIGTHENIKENNIKNENIQDNNDINIEKGMAEKDY